MYCWGKAQQGALGLGGIEELYIPVPAWNKYLAEGSIRTVACGQDHTVFLMDNDSLFSCGNNEFGQLGQETGTMRPAPVEGVGYWKVLDVKCGLYHTVVITLTGTILAWGDNSCGQLTFTDAKYQRTPRLVELPVSDRQVVQVACGGHHTAVLLKDSRVYSWGKNNYGQLGHTPEESMVSKPKLIAGLESFPIKRIVAGGAHNFAISVTGSVLGWGRNSYGQLGISARPVDFFPIPRQLSLENIRVAFVSCGEEHTVVLVEDGSVFTCGSNRYGQLGRETMEDTSPLLGAVPELMGSKVSQIACGKYHSVVLLKDSGRMLSFGLNRSGELGGKSKGSGPKFAHPLVVEGEWLPHSSLEDYKAGSPVDRGNVVRRIFAGGNQSFASVYVPSSIRVNEQALLPAFDQGLTKSIESPLFLTFESLKQMLDVALLTKTFDSTLDTLNMFFSSPSCINGSFLRKEYRTVNDHIAIDLNEIQRTYDTVIDRLQHFDYLKKLNELLFKTALDCTPRPVPCNECLRVYCFMLTHPLVKKFPDCVKLLVPFIKVFLFITDREREVVVDWLFKRPKEIILEWIEIFRNPIEKILERGKKNMQESKAYRHFVVFLTDDETWALQEGIKLLKWIYHANIERHEPIHYKKFYVENIGDCCDLKEDYIGFLNKKVDRVVFTRYYFVLNASAKAEVLQTDARLTQMQARAQAHASFFMHSFLRPMGPQAAQVNPDFCEIAVHRETILRDALSGLLSCSGFDLKKPLMVNFVGEDGLDWGGMTKEFFMLLMKEILNPMYGLFYEEDESRLLWFREQPAELLEGDLQQFFLVGMICGLAIYNGVNLDLPFPLVIHKKMLGGNGIHKPTLEDLAVLKPSVGKHLKDMLELDDDTFETIFPDLTFEIARVYFGGPVTIDLLPGGSTVRVDRTNRHKYVDCYVHYELVEGIEKQFNAFLDGFRRVYNTNCEIYKILHPEELMSFIVGSSTYDFEELKKHTEYLNGYTSDHQSICHFWNAVMDLPVEAKKKLLVFWTGSDRIPITGIKSMKLRIQRMDGGVQFSKLPVAHTCANILDLPPYPTAELMREKILKAIYFTSGFGIV